MAAEMPARSTLGHAPRSSKALQGDFRSRPRVQEKNAAYAHEGSRGAATMKRVRTDSPCKLTPLDMQMISISTLMGLTTRSITATRWGHKPHPIVKRLVRVHVEAQLACDSVQRKRSRRDRQQPVQIRRQQHGHHLARRLNLAQNQQSHLSCF